MKNFLPIVLQILSDSRVIGTVIVMFLIVQFAFFVSAYTKKAPKSKKKKNVQKSQPVEKTEETKSEEQTS